MMVKTKDHGEKSSLPVTQSLPSYTDYLSAFSSQSDQPPPNYSDVARKGRNGRRARADQSVDTEIIEPQGSVYVSSRARKKRFIQNELKNNFPLAYTVFQIVILLAVGCSSVALEAYLIILQTGYYYVLHGFWAGFYSIMLAVVCILLASFRSYVLYVLTFVGHLVGMVVFFAGLLVVNIMSISQNNPYNSLFITMLVIGVIGFISSLLYFVFLNTRMNPKLRSHRATDNVQLTPVTVMASTSSSRSRGQTPIWTINIV